MLTPVSPRDRTEGVVWRCGVRVCQSGESAVVHPHGELDLATAPRLDMLLRELRREGTRHVTVDLADVTFLDTAGLRVLLEYDRLLQGRRGELRIANACQRVVRLLHVTRTAYLLADPVHAAADPAGSAAA